MPRILICECKQEVATFNPVLGRYSDFVISHGQDILDYHRRVASETGGAISVFDAETGVEIIPGYSARASTSGGTLAQPDFGRIAGEFLASVRGASPVDAIYYSLHGALAAEEEFDVEGYLIEQTRAIVGERIPIVASLDLHGVLTDRILRHADAVVPYHTYPHVDFFQTGQRAARLLLKILAGAARPVSIRVPIPALVRGNELITETGMFGRCVRRTIAFENSPDGLAGGMFIGNPFTDVPDLCSNVLLVANGDAGRAEREACSIAEEFWAMRHHLQQPLTELRDGVEQALAAKGRIVLVDAADATSSGAPGDSNAILRALVEAGCRRTALIPLVDPAAAQAAFRAGVGSEVTMPVGGALDRQRHRPLEVRARVRLLSDGRMRSESHGEAWDGGPTAVVEVGSITLVILSRPVHLYDRSVFFAAGQDPAAFDLVVVKSPHCQRRFFEEGAERLIHIDAPGATSANLKSLGHSRCVRPIFPLDDEVTFTPQPRRFARS